MRNFTCTLLFFLTVYLVSCKPTMEQAIDYNDKIIATNDSISAKIDRLVDTYDQFVPAEMDKAYSEAMDEAKKGIDFATKLKPFDNDSSFKEGALVLFDAYKSVLEVQHKRIIELLKLPESEYGEEEVAEYERLIETANQKMDEEIDKLITVQENFSNTHQFEIIEEK